MVSFESICKSAIPIIKEVGSYIRTERTLFDVTTVQNKSARDLVSYVDQTSEKMLVEKLSKLLPEAGFITEEKTTEKTGKLNWIIDPLDGTTNFIKGYPVYSSTIALAEGNKVLLGITYDIPEDKCYYAWDGGGAFCNNEPIHAKKTAELSNALIIAGYPYNMDNLTEQYFGLIRYLYENSLGVRTTGSAAMDMAYVASGQADAYVQFNIYPWDIAAGYLLVKEAGGFATNFSGADDFNCREIIACGPFHKELLEITRKFLC